MLLGVAALLRVQGFFFFPTETYAVYGSLLVGLVAAGLILSGPILLSRARSAFLIRLQEERFSRVSQAIEELNPTDLKTIINLNREQMDQYHALTMAQAADAYKRAQFAMLLGFLILVLGALATFGRLTNGSAETYTAGALTSLGTLLSGFVARTFLTTYRDSLSQLNFFFEQPLVSSYLLTAERLSSQVSAGKKDDALVRIIDRILTATISRSAHPQNRKPETGGGKDDAPPDPSETTP